MALCTIFILDALFMLGNRMPLKRTQELMKQYAKKPFTDEDLIKLLNHGAFTKSPGYRDLNQPVSDTNHTAYEAMQDFVVALGAHLDEQAFHALAERVIRLAPEVTTENTYMRDNNLDKVFLAYALARYPASADQHFAENSRVMSEQKSAADFFQFRNVIIGPIVGTLSTKIAEYNPNPTVEQNKIEQPDLEGKKDKVTITDQIKNQFKKFKAEIEDLKAKLTGEPTRAEKKARDEMVIKRVEDNTVKVDEKPKPKTVLDDDYDEKPRIGPGNSL